MLQETQTFCRTHTTKQGAGIGVTILLDRKEGNAVAVGPPAANLSCS